MEILQVALALHSKNPGLMKPWQTLEDSWRGGKAIGSILLWTTSKVRQGQRARGWWCQEIFPFFFGKKTIRPCIPWIAPIAINGEEMVMNSMALGESQIVANIWIWLLELQGLGEFHQHCLMIFCLGVWGGGLRPRVNTPFASSKTLLFSYVPELHTFWSSIPVINT